MIKRRQVLKLGAGLLASQAIAAGVTASVDDGKAAPQTTMRPIPSSGELIPAIGMGTSRTFDLRANPENHELLSTVMQALFAAGGTVIDSSPMYGEAESRVGDVLRQMAPRPKIFAATKVWTNGKENGIAQMETSAQRLAVARLDLIAVHNLRDWETHINTLKDWKQQERVRYIGITTSHGRNHTDFLDVMRKEPLDFVQFSYNIEDRTAEQYLLPLAQERGIAAMINRPFQRGSLFKKVKGRALPAVATDLQCTSWAQFFLKFILSHPAVTNIIPATADLRHMQDNMMANVGSVPDKDQRTEMLNVFKSL